MPGADTPDSPKILPLWKRPILHPETPDRTIMTRTKTTYPFESLIIDWRSGPSAEHANVTWLGDRATKQAGCSQGSRQERTSRRRRLCLQGLPTPLRKHRGVAPERVTTTRELSDPEHSWVRLHVLWVYIKKGVLSSKKKS